VTITHAHRVIFRGIVQAHLESLCDEVNHTLLLSRKREQTISIVSGHEEYLVLYKTYLSHYTTEYIGELERRHIQHKLTNDSMTEGTISDSNFVGHSLAKYPVETYSVDEKMAIQIMASTRAQYDGR
jgi:hypothetical protein